MKKNVSTLAIIFLFVSLTLYAQISNDNNYMDNLNSIPPISVTIGGDFIVTGSFPAYSGERVDQYITRIYNEVKSQIPYPSNNDELFIKTLSQTNNYALRGMILKSKNGGRTTLDLLKFRLGGDFLNNPYLKNDDVLIFPAYDLEYDFIEISGAVNKPIKFQFVEGDKLSDAIFFARGINKAYEGADTAIISRLSYDGKTEQQIIVNVDSDFELERGDRIKIAADQTNRKDYKVLVLGEVNKPGYIYITKDNTTLKEVIEKAGGFTPNASLKAAEIIRNYTNEQVLKKYAYQKEAEEDPSKVLLSPDPKSWRILETLRMYRSSDMYFEDTTFFNISNELRILEGTKLVDFTKLDSSNSTTAKFILKENDLIIVPEKNDAVYIFGQVATPGYYKFIPGKKHDYYIQKAGGFTGGAEEDEIFIIKGTSREWISYEDEYSIEPGDYIYIVKDIRRDFWWWVYQAGTIASIIGSIATILLLVANVSK